jgi:hypothetical protein
MKVLTAIEALAGLAAAILAVLGNWQLAFALMTLATTTAWIKQAIAHFQRRLLIVPCQIKAGTLDMESENPTHNIYVRADFKQDRVYIELSAAKIDKPIPKCFIAYLRIVANSERGDRLNVESCEIQEDHSVSRLFL